MVRSLALIALLGLAGCATGPAPAIKTVTVTVDKLVPVPCVGAADIPTRPAPLAPRPADDREAVRMLLAKLLEAMGPGGYIDRADPLLHGCASANPARVSRGP